MPGAAMTAVATAASVALIPANRLGLQRSLSISDADTSVPPTNPNWTDMVSQAWKVGVVCHSAAIEALDTVAANHGIMPKTMAALRRASWGAARPWVGSVSSIPNNLNCRSLSAARLKENE